MMILSCPIFLLIFIIDLDYDIRNWILKFADDTKIFSHVSRPEDCASLQRDLHKLVNWSEEWQMPHVKLRISAR